MKKIGIIVLLIGLMSCHKGYITDGYYRSATGLLQVVKDSVYFRSSHGIGYIELGSGVYKIKRNRMYITLNYPNSTQEGNSRPLRWNHKEKVWVLGRGFLKTSFDKLEPD